MHNPGVLLADEFIYIQCCGVQSHLGATCLTYPLTVGGHWVHSGGDLTTASTFPGPLLPLVSRSACVSWKSRLFVSRSAWSTSRFGFCVWGNLKTGGAQPVGLNLHSCRACTIRWGCPGHQQTTNIILSPSRKGGADHNNVRCIARGASLLTDLAATNWV